MTEQSWPKIFTDKDDFIRQYRLACEREFSKPHEELGPQERY